MRLKKCIVLFVTFLLVFQPLLNAVLLRNDFIEVEVDDESSRFVLRTTGGDPKLETDQDKNLLYEMPNYPGTSYTTIHIDKKDYIFGSNSGVYVERPHISDGKIISVWKVKKIQVKQTISIVEGPTTGNLDTILIEYEIRNIGTRQRYVGVRILMDTLLGENDGAPFSVPGVGAITTDYKFVGANIPKFWYAYDKAVNPTVRSMGTILIEGYTPPDVLIMSNWKKMHKSPWDVKLKQGMPFKYSLFSPTDSAISIYWKTRILAPGQSFRIATMYGLYGVAEESSEHFNLIIGGPYQVNEGDIFIVTADIENKSPVDTVQDLSAVLELPPTGELTFPENEKPVKKIDKLSPNEIGKVKWNVKAVKEGTAIYSVRFKGYVKLAGGREEREIVAERKVVIKKRKEEKKKEKTPEERALEETQEQGRRLEERLSEREQLMRIYAPHLRLPRFEYQLHDYDMSEIDKRIQRANSEIRKLNDEIHELEIKLGIVGDTY